MSPLVLPATTCWYMKEIRWNIDVEITKQETWGPQPVVTGGNPPSYPPLHPSLRGWHSERNLPALQWQTAGGSFWKPHFQQSRAQAWAGGSHHPLCVWPQQWKEILNPASRHEDSSDCTSREFHSFLILKFSESKCLKRPMWQGRQWRIGSRDSNILLPIQSS